MSSDDVPISQQFWTVKIAGVPGSGKTTLLTRIKQSQLFNCETITYSNLLREHGSQRFANHELAKILNCSNGLVIMDEHLEFENPNRPNNYVKENTKGLILLDPPLSDLLLRINKDCHKPRPSDVEKINNDMCKSRILAHELARKLNIPLLIDHNLHGELEKTFTSVVRYLEKLHTYDYSK